MVKVSVFYPNRPGSHFDMSYYCSKHIPMVQRLLDSTLNKKALLAPFRALRRLTSPSGSSSTRSTASRPSVDSWSSTLTNTTACFRIRRFADRRQTRCTSAQEGRSPRT